MSLPKCWRAPFVQKEQTSVWAQVDCTLKEMLFSDVSMTLGQVRLTSITRSETTQKRNVATVCWKESDKGSHLTATSKCLHFVIKCAHELLNEWLVGGGGTLWQCIPQLQATTGAIAGRVLPVMGNTRQFPREVFPTQKFGPQSHLNKTACFGKGPR